MPTDDREVLRQEFARAAPGFAERTAGRFDKMGVVEFARVRSHETVLEVGAGTGNFLSLFEGAAARLVALDLTEEMLHEAGRRHPGQALVLGNAFALPFASRSVELVASAQALHHIHEPVPVLKEMRRVCAQEGRVLIVDQLATESYEQIAFMNQVEALRDPSHAMSRPASAFRTILMAAGLEIVEERVFEDRSRFSNWMWPGEFPPERIEAVRDFVARFGPETGMHFEPDGDDWTFTRRRIMLLARRPA
ncbi:MAG TPA: class I SAM-dependent methyltransferase [Actinomycetota bacterium]|nr:class I SAM-dependent methyltransferase [Actinomycetota bacterium]